MCSDSKALGPVYICGPMTGIKDFNYPLFNATAARWRKAGYEVENPAEINASRNTTREEYLARDIERLLKCKAIATLPGWQDSKGARIEMAIARELKMTHYEA